MEIIPAILERDFEQIKAKLDFLVHVKETYNTQFKKVQIDLADSIFVKNLTWLPIAKDIEEKNILAKYSKYFELEYHLMCEDQLKYMKAVIQLEAKKVIVHIDKVFNEKSLEEIINLAKEKFIKLFITAKLDFLVKEQEKLKRFLLENRQINLQIMSIDNLGSQGQSFDERCLTLAEFFREEISRHNFYIQLDGGVNQLTIEEISKYQIDGLVVGSDLGEFREPEDFVRRFRNLQSQI